jgi:hypothetical protein
MAPQTNRKMHCRLKVDALTHFSDPDGVSKKSARRGDMRGNIAVQGVELCATQTTCREGGDEQSQQHL